MPFVHFMELALHCPELGFYDRFPHRIGRAGDFFTSVSVGPVFGQLLAFCFADWLRHLGEAPLHLVEAGAHDGQLALDIMTWLRANDPLTYNRIDYIILEPSPRRQAWQRAKLSDFSGRVRWVRGWKGMPSRSVRGIIFSNELMDAFPVRRFGWEAASREWFEWGVTLRENRFVWCKLPLNRAARPIDSAPPTVPEQLRPILPDGFTVEMAPQAATWWRQAATALGEGYLLTLDYGLASESLLDPNRPQGTLRAYRQHRTAPDILADPGEQDITAQVDFTGLRAAGEAAGLRTLDLVSQGRFLTGVFEHASRKQVPGFEWSDRRLRQFQMLTHPVHLGERFKVLIQAAGSIRRSDSAGIGLA